MTDVCCDLDIPLDSVSHDNQFVDNVLIYISGFIMRKLIEKEKCTYCYTYLTECKERVSCQLINFKQLKGTNIVHFLIFHDIIIQFSYAFDIDKPSCKNKNIDILYEHQDFRLKLNLLKVYIEICLRKMCNVL